MRTYKINRSLLKLFKHTLRYSNSIFFNIRINLNTKPPPPTTEKNNKKILFVFANLLKFVDLPYITDSDSTLGDCVIFFVLFLSKTTKLNLLFSIHEEVCIDFIFNYHLLLSLFLSLSLSLSLSFIKSSDLIELITNLWSFSFLFLLKVQKFLK